MRLATAAVLVALTGCVAFPGDGAFSVVGSLPATAGACQLLLLSDGDTEVPYSRRRVRGRFEADFTVAPTARVYQVGVLCGGRISKVATVRYGTEVGAGQRISLGEIAL